MSRLDTASAAVDTLTEATRVRWPAGLCRAASLAESRGSAATVRVRASARWSCIAHRPECRTFDSGRVGVRLARSASSRPSTVDPMAVPRSPSPVGVERSRVLWRFGRTRLCSYGILYHHRMARDGVAIDRPPERGNVIVRGAE